MIIAHTCKTTATQNRPIAFTDKENHKQYDQLDAATLVVLFGSIKQDWDIFIPCDIVNFKGNSLSISTGH